MATSSQPIRLITKVPDRRKSASRKAAELKGPCRFPVRIGRDEAGPLLCGGITVFAPLAMHAKPTDRVGIIGIGGLGHMAVKFAAAYGCGVTAFTSSESKFDEAKGFGAHEVVSSLDSMAIGKLAGKFDLLSPRAGWT